MLWGESPENSEEKAKAWAAAATGSGAATEAGADPVADTKSQPSLPSGYRARGEVSTSSPLPSDLLASLNSPSCKELNATLAAALQVVRAQREYHSLPLAHHVRKADCNALPPLPPERHGGHVHLRTFPERSLIVFGDTHGDLVSLLTILSRSRFIPRVEAGEDLFLVGLGDYINKGTHSLENVYVLAYLINHPALQGRVIPLLGNHESESCRGKGSAGYRRNRFIASLAHHRALSHANEYESRLLSSLLVSLFSEFAVSFDTNNGIFASHAGSSRNLCKLTAKAAAAELTKWPPSHTVSDELLQSVITSGNQPRHENLPMTLNRTEVFDFMKQRGSTLLLRGHQPVPPEGLRNNQEWRKGFWWMTTTHNTTTRRVLTLNSCTLSPRVMPAFAEIRLSSSMASFNDCAITAL